MWNTAPFVLDFVVVANSVAVVHFVEFQVLLAHYVGCQRLSLFHKVVCDCFEFGKHCLAVHCCAKHVEVVLKKVLLDFFVLFSCKQVLQQQHFVASGSNFRNKNFVACFCLWLRLFGVVGVDGVAHFVRNCEDVVCGFLVVEKHVGVNARNAHGIRTTALCGCFVNVDPTVVEGRFHDLTVVFAQGSKALDNKLASILVLAGNVGIFENGCVQVVHVESFHAHQLFAKSNVAVKWLEGVVHALDEIVVHSLVYLFVEQRTFHCATKLASLCVEHVCLDTAFVQAGKCVDFFDVRLVVGFESQFANGLVFVLQASGIGAVAKLNGLSVHLDGFEFQIATVQTVENFLELTGKTAHVGKQKFFRFGQNVRFATKHVCKLHVVVGKSRVGNECLKLLVGKGGKFRRHKGRQCATLCEEAVHFGKACLPFGVLAVFVVAHECVAVQLFQVYVQLVGKFQKFQQTVSVGKFALVLGKAWVTLLQLLESLFPCFGCCKDIPKVPFVLFGNFTSFCVSHSLYLLELFFVGCNKLLQKLQVLLAKAWVLQCKFRKALDVAKLVAKVVALALEFVGVDATVFGLDLETVRKVHFATTCCRCDCNNVENVRRNNVPAQRRKQAENLAVVLRFFHNVANFVQPAVAFHHLAGCILANDGFFHKLHANDGFLALLVGFHKLRRDGFAGVVDDVVAVQHGKWLAVCPFLGKFHSLARACDRWLVHEGNVGKVCQFSKGVGFHRFATLAKLLLVGWVGCEMAHHVLLFGGNYHHHVGDAGAGNFFNDKLQGRFVYHGKHFLGVSLGVGQKPCALACCKNQRFFNFHFATSLRVIVVTRYYITFVGVRQVAICTTIVNKATFFILLARHGKYATMVLMGICVARWL